LAATRADFLCRVGREPESLASYRAALELAPTDAERQFLRRRISEITAGRENP
jgi:RNA polymerase sigma-70 factor (ECF subfamily)